MKAETLGIVAITVLVTMLAMRLDPVRDFMGGGNKFFR